MCDSGDHRQDHLSHLQPGQPRLRHSRPHLVHIGLHLDKPHTVHQSLDYRTEMGPYGRLCYGWLFNI